MMCAIRLTKVSLYMTMIDLSIADGDVPEITEEKEILWFDGRRMEATHFNGND